MTKPAGSGGAWWVLVLPAALAAVLLGLSWALPLLLPVALAWVLAEAIEGPVQAMQARGVPRELAVVLALLGLALALAATLTLGVAHLVSELRELAAHLPALVAVAAQIADALALGFQAVSDHLPAAARAFLLEQATAMGQAASAKAGRLIAAVGALPVLASDLVFAFMAAYFVCRDRRALGRFFYGLLPRDLRPAVSGVRRQLLASALGLLWAQVTLMAVTGLLTAAGLGLLGVRYAFSLGFLAALADAVPLLGPAILFVPWTLYHLLLGDATLGLLLAGLFAGIVVIRQVAEPRLVGRRLGVSPLAALVSAYLGLKLWGLTGYVAGPLLVVWAKAMVQSGIVPIFRHCKFD